MDQKKRALQRRQEDKALHRALIWMGGAAALELLLVSVNNWYFHFTTAPESVARALFVEQLLIFFRFAAPILLAACLVLAVRQASSESGVRSWLAAALALSAVITLTANVILVFQAPGLRMLLLLIPALGGLGMVYHLYQREFFLSAALSGLGIVSLWMLRHLEARTGMAVCLFLGVTILALLGVCLLLLMERRGKPVPAGIRLSTGGGGGSSALGLTTAAINALCLVLALTLGRGLAFYLMYLLVAWIFALLVYYTAKMM